MIYAWFALYFVVYMSVPEKREQRGYIWRLLKRLPPWRWITGNDVLSRVARFWILVAVWSFAVDLMHLSHAQNDAAIVGGVVVLLLDDYVNGDDDDRWKLGEWARNAVKWLMELPPAPRESETA